jgi:hypothetical protein
VARRARFGAGFNLPGQSWFHSNEFIGPWARRPAVQ